MQFGRTALNRAALNGHTAIVQYLVEKTSAQVNAADNVSHSTYCKVYYCTCTLGSCE